MHSDIFSQQSNRQGPDTCKVPKGECPSWDVCRNVCLQVKNGLFLPVAQHITAYCQSSRHPSCPHYRLHTTKRDSSTELPITQIDRRRSVRISARHLFHISEIITNGQVVEPQQDKAWTIDLSETGVRFACKRIFPADTTIYFSLQLDDITNNTEEIGHVIWSEPLANTSLFQTGIAYAEQRSRLHHP